MDGGHEAFDDGEVVMDDLGKGSQAVGGAGGIAMEVGGKEMEELMAEDGMCSNRGNCECYSRSSKHATETLRVVMVSGGLRFGTTR